MKVSLAQARIVARMASGARLRWDNTTGAFRLADHPSVRTVQGRTVDALSPAGLIVRDALGDCALTLAGKAHGAAAS